MAGRFFPRAVIGLRRPNPNRLTARTPDEYGEAHRGLTRHWTGATGAYGQLAAFARLRAIQRYHMDVLGYGDIAYEGAHDGDGNTYGLRDARYVGAHARSTANYANRLTDGIVWLEDARGWTAGAERGFAWWSSLYRLAHHRPPVEYAHEWWAKGKGGTVTACPGRDLIAHVASAGGKT